MTDEFLLPVCVEGRPRLDPARDSAIFFNFRPDRARQLAIKLRELGVDLTTMTRYRDDLDCPVAFGEQLVQQTLAEVLAHDGVRQLHCAETEKYAHVTYFFNGGREEPWEGETRILVPSPRDVPSYDHKPEMAAREVTERFCAELPNGYGFAVVNFANPDMVGHTGSIQAVVQAVETVDECLLRVVETVENLGGACLVTADHGNAEHMLEADGVSPFTAHTTNPVPLDPDRTRRAPPGGRRAQGPGPDGPPAPRTGQAGRDDRELLGQPGLNRAILPRPVSLQQPDLGVLRKAQRGDERAFSLILRAYETPVYNYVLRLVNDRSLAEDLTQEVFLRVFQGLPKFSLRSKFTTWLFQVTKNRVLDELRSIERRPRAVVALEDVPPFEVLDAPFERLEAIDAVWRAVENLSVDLKMALLLRDIVGLSYTEIADSLEITLATVKWRIYKAREEVQLALAREGIKVGSSAEEPAAAVVIST